MPKTPGVELVNCHQLIPSIESRSYAGAHRHDAHELIFVCEGRYRGNVERRRYDLNSGEGIIYPAGVEHRGDLTYDGSLRLLMLQWRGDPVVDGIRVFADPSGQVRNGLHWLHGLPMDDPRRERQRQAVMVALLEQVRWQLEEDFYDPIAEMHRFMETTCDHPITMDLLSHRSGLAVSTINQRFRERYGVPPMQFLQRVRAFAAANLLRGSRDDLASIAEQVGLRSVSHLCCMLKKHLGVGARELRRATKVQRPRTLPGGHRPRQGPGDA